MPYTLERLAPGSYDLILDGVIIGSVVLRVDTRGDAEAWLAELLEEGQPLPSPFKQDTHEFTTLEGVTRWLDAAAPE